MDSFDQSTSDLDSIKDILWDFFDFELALAKTVQKKTVELKNTGPFKQLRSELTNHMKKLNSATTYPKFIPKLGL